MLGKPNGWLSRGETEATVKDMQAPASPDSTAPVSLGGLQGVQMVSPVGSRGKWPWRSGLWPRSRRQEAGGLTVLHRAMTLPLRHLLPRCALGF